MPDLRDALLLLDSGAWLSLAVVSYDKKRGTAGDIIRLDRCRLLTGGGNNHSTSIKASTATEDRRDPHHGEHFTRMVVTSNHKRVKVHPRLIFAINNQLML